MPGALVHTVWLPHSPGVSLHSSISKAVRETQGAVFLACLFFGNYIFICFWKQKSIGIAYTIAWVSNAGYNMWIVHSITSKAGTVVRSN